MAASPRPMRKACRCWYCRRLSRAGWRQVPFNFSSTREMAGVSKHAVWLYSASEIPSVMRRAFTQLRNGRFQPVVVEVPIDVFDEESRASTMWPVIRTPLRPDPDAVAKAADLLVAAKRPVIYAGQGVHWAAAYAELQALAELLAAPVCTSLPGKSAFDETHPLALGSGGNGVPRAVPHFLERADVIFGIAAASPRPRSGSPSPRARRSSTPPATRSTSTRA